MNSTLIRSVLGVAAAAIVTADIVNPQYSPVSETVSRYVNGTAGWLITVAILGIGWPRPLWSPWATLWTAPR